MFGDFNNDANRPEYFGKPEPYARHLSSSKEFRWSCSPDLVTGEDLVEGSCLYMNGDDNEIGWIIWPVGTPRTPMGMFVCRHDPVTGITYTRVENG